jgi:hypothetical protein
VRLNDGECRGCGGRLGTPPLFSLGDEDEDVGKCHTLASLVQQLIKLWAVRRQTAKAGEVSNEDLLKAVEMMLRTRR